MKKIGYLDGMRGICCFIVVIDHSIGMLKPDLRATNLDGIGGVLRRLISFTPVNIFYTGAAPVCLFFILSGFVLSLKFFKDSNNFYSLPKDVIKRYPRLVIPVLLSSLVMFFLYEVSNIFFGTTFNVYLIDLIYQSVYLAPFFHVSVENGVLWSISYEIYGSFLVFSIISIFRKCEIFNKIAFLIFIFLLWTGSYYSLFVFGLLSCKLVYKNCFNFSKKIRIIFIFCGIFLASVPYPRAGIDMYSGVYGFMGMFKSFDYNKTQQLFVMIGSMLIFVSCLNSDMAEKMLSKKIFIFLGRISFSLYLLHSCILAVMKGILSLWDVQYLQWQEYILAFLILMIVALPISYMFNKIVDRNSVIISNKFSDFLLKKQSSG